MGVKLYERLGYTTYRRVLGYYSNVEDALGVTALLT
jgi:ribosomal protein S18 acetylase RimI-like enzyme